MSSYIPQASNVSVKQTGFTTLVLGAEAYAVSNGSGSATSGNGYIVVSADPTERVENIETPQGSGLTAVVTQIKDGVDFRVTVEEDANLAPPHVGSIIAAVNPFLTTAGWNVAPLGANVFTSGLYLVLNNDVRVERKQINQRTLMLRSYVAIANANGGGLPVI